MFAPENKRFNQTIACGGTAALRTLAEVGVGPSSCELDF
jgi:hypothetical protein